MAIIILISNYSCFIHDIRVHYGLFLVPLFVIIIFNTISFVLVIRVIMKHRKTHQKKKSDRSQYIKTIVIVFCLMSMFGLFWILGAASVQQASIFFEWPFIVLNTSQGILLFIFVALINAREEWSSLLTCRRYSGKKKTSLISSKGYKINSTKNSISANKTSVSTISSRLRQNSLYKAPDSPNQSPTNFLKIRSRQDSDDDSIVINLNVITGDSRNEKSNAIEQESATVIGNGSTIENTNFIVENENPDTLDHESKSVIKIGENVICTIENKNPDAVEDESTTVIGNGSMIEDIN